MVKIGEPFKHEYGICHNCKRGVEKRGGKWVHQYSKYNKSCSSPKLARGTKNHSGFPYPDDSKMSPKSQERYQQVMGTLKTNHGKGR